MPDVIHICLTLVALLFLCFYQRTPLDLARIWCHEETVTYLMRAHQKMLQVSMYCWGQLHMSSTIYGSKLGSTNITVMQTFPHSGLLRHVIQCSCICNIKVMGSAEINLTIKCKQGIEAFYIALSHSQIPIHELFSQLGYVGHASTVYMPHSAIEHFNHKWPLHITLPIVSVKLVVAEQKNAKQDIRIWIEGSLSYHLSIPKFSGKKDLLVLLL